jgi:hypothetical protein
MHLNSSNVIYWLFAFRLIDKNELIQWADALISEKFASDELYDLSTCREMDENEVMDKIKKVNFTNNRNFDVELLICLRDYYKNVDNGINVNLATLINFEGIDEIHIDIRRKLDRLMDEIQLARDGIKIFKANESKLIVDELNIILSAQQADASDLVTNAIFAPTPARKK